MKTKSHLLLLALLAIASPAFSAQPKAGPRLEMGEFTATRFEISPAIDGTAAPGEWDRALTTSGLIVPFDQKLQEADTTISFGFDKERLYFLFRCGRGDGEWKLAKKSRLNDDYSFGEPSVEIWVSPPAAVAETYQNIINTYPAVFDLHQIPTRGYSAQGWKADWKVAESETDSEYVIEASVPIKDFGFDGIKNGDVWKFLLARNALKALPRPQASWTISQGFAEIPQHPPVHMMDDEAVVQLKGVPTVLSGKYTFEIGVAAARAKGADAEIEVRFQKEVTPSADDLIEKKTLSVKAGERNVANFTGDVTAMGKGFFSVTVTNGGTRIFRQNFPFAVSGWVAKKPVRPENIPAPEELAVSAQFGPETGTVLVKADILDLPAREEVAAAEVKVVDPASGKTLASGPMRHFKEWYGGAELHIAESEVPVDDFRKVADFQLKNREIRDRNMEHKKKKEQAEALIEIPQTPARKVQVAVTLQDKTGKEIKSATKDLDLIRYSAEWMNNKVGMTDKVIPPWTPVQVKGADVSVWNRTLSFDALGLGTQVVNGGAKQLATPMRLVAVKDGQEIELKGGAPKVSRQVENEVDFTGSTEAAGLRFSSKTKVEFDGFVNINLDVAPIGKEPAQLDKLFLEIELPAEMATHYCTTAGGWAAVHDALPDHWSSQQTASGMLTGDFVPYIWLTDSEHAFLWFADHDKGWNHEAGKALPTQELIRKDGKVILRVNFFEIPTEVTQSRTITWGWQTFPTRPLPKGWRATYCNSAPPAEHTKNSYFWTSADWAVLWPYFASPFPWHFDVSKELMIKAAHDPRHRPMPGSIAHSIARYQDYDWNKFPGLAVDWAATPGDLGNCNVTSSNGPNEFRLWHYQRWVKEGDLRGLYVDENYLALEDNFLTGNAYWREDGLLQRAYNYVGLREYFKRMKVMFHENNIPEPNLWQHVSSGAAYHAWFGDVFFEGENVEPTNLQDDYIEVLPAGRLRSIGSSVVNGGIMTMMCQSERHRTQWADKHTHQFVGWVMAHDILPEQSKLYPRLVEAGHLWADDVKFLPYWKPSPFITRTKDCMISAHVSGDLTTLWVVNISRKDETVRVVIDWKKAGLNPQEIVAFNSETSEPVAPTADGLSVPVLQRDFVPILLAPKGTVLPPPPSPGAPVQKK